MPSSRRFLSRINAPSFMSPVNKGPATNTSSERENVVPLAAIVVLPYHPHLPEIPVNSNLFFEVMMYMYGVIVMALQYMNLYKTVWWLPQSHMPYSLHFYLIDPYLVVLLNCFLCYRPLCCFIQEDYGLQSLRKIFAWLIQSVKLILTVFLLVTFLWSTYHVIQKHSLLYIVFLCYPAVTYLVLFGPTLLPLYHTSLVWPLPVERVRPQVKRTDTQSIAGLQHICTLHPDIVREEVNRLKSDFNNRMKQVLFHATVITYYSAFIPVCFVESSLNYNGVVAGHYIFMTWSTSFLLFVLHFLPPSYIDLLHRCCLHLGRWKKAESPRHSHVPSNAWSELQVWPNGALVKHVRGLFKADGVNVTAEPGNSMHGRYYFLFSEPTWVFNCLLTLAWIVVAYQFAALTQSFEWNQIISCSFMLFCNYYVLFKLIRDRIILSKVYTQPSDSHSDQNDKNS